MKDFDTPFKKQIETVEVIMNKIFCKVCGALMGTCSDDWTGYGICQDCCPCCLRTKTKSQLPKHLKPTGEIFEAMLKEISHASSKYPPFHSMHEGYAVILEELDELKEAIWKSKGVRLNPIAAKEAIQVAAMAVRFILDLEGEKE